MSVAPNHDIFYGLVGSGGPHGIIYKANTTAANGSFTALPAAPLPASLTNNIMTILCNVNSEPIVGIFRSNTADPFLFRYDNSSNTWTTSSVDFLPNLGAYCSAKAPNGDLWVGTKWSYIYKSIDNGATFSRIDETPIVAASYPCYYPTWGGNPGDGAIYSINVDANGRVYAGTEGAGVIYSDDAGVTWNPADYNACQTGNNTLKDSTSAMVPITNTGNLGGIGFTAGNNVIFNGTQMWTYNWNTTLGLADMTAHTVTACNGFPLNFISTGLQVTKIVTTANGNIFLHSGSNGSGTGTIGIYTSTDGINWSLCNTGIVGDTVNTAQGSLAVDGNKVFMATPDGKVWMLDVSVTASAGDNLTATSSLKVYPTIATSTLTFDKAVTGIFNYCICTVNGTEIQSGKINTSDKKLDVSALPAGFYFLNLVDNNKFLSRQKFIKVSASN